MFATRTDLAMENVGAESSLPGVDVHRWEESDIQLSEVVIRTEEAARNLGKPCGNYHPPATPTHPRALRPSARAIRIPPKLRTSACT